MTDRRIGLRHLAAALGALVAVLLVAVPAAATPYSNAGSHYSFDFPTGWTQNQTGSVDATFLGPAAGGFRPNIVVQHERETSARNDSAWLLQYVKNSFDALKAQLTVNEVEAPRIFTTASGRLAGDYIFEQVVANMTIRQRQVFFVSEFHDLTFYMTLSDRTSSYTSHAADWAQAVDSFAVSGEPAPSLPFVPLALGGAAVAGAGAVAAVAIRKRKKRAAAARSAWQAPPAGLPPPPPTA